MSKSLRELADLVQGDLEGDAEILITGAADISDAREGDIVFAETPKFLDAAKRSGASAVIVRSGMSDSGKPMIAVPDPRYAFAQVLRAFAPSTLPGTGIHPACNIAEGVRIGDSPSVGFNVSIGRDSALGDNVCIYPFAYIGSDVHIGSDCVIHPFVSIYDGVTLGSGVVVHSGSVIGADGFGYTKLGQEHYKMPQIGTVVIGDDVEIGANVTVDRARTGKTEIGRGTKIDNLVHIAHNTVIGQNCIIVAQVGISGSVGIGDRVVLAGQAGVKDHVTIGDDAVVCARAGVIGNIRNGEFVSGFPARPHSKQMRMQAAQNRLPELLRTIRDLQRRVEELESRR